MNIETISNTTMSSVEIAEITNKRHSHVLRDIRVMIDQTGENIDEELCTQTKRISKYNLNKDLTICLISGYDASLRLKIIKRWKELEKPQHQIPQTLSQALLLASQQAEQIEHQKEQLAIAAPKVEFVDRFVESTGNKTFREVAKMLKANEREFRAFLYETKVMYQLGGGWTARANHIDAGRFYVTGGEANGHAYTTCKFTPKGIEYIAGKWVAHKELS